MSNYRVKLNVDRDLEKIIDLTRDDQNDLDIDEDGIDEEELLGWVVANVPPRDWNGSLLRLLVGNTVDTGHRYIYWIIDYGNGTPRIVQISNPDDVNQALAEMSGYISVLDQAAKGSTTKYIDYVNSGSGSRAVGFGQHLIIDSGSTITNINLDVTYAGRIGETFLIQNYKSSGTLTIALGSNIILNGLSNVITAGSSLELRAVANNIGSTNYKFAKIN